MGYRKHLAMIFAVSLLLTMAVGCHHTKDKPIWEQLEEAQYNSYKPRLDHMIEKYGDMFEMDVYGTITCTEPEYKDWRIACDATDNYSAVDNFAIRLGSGAFYAGNRGADFWGMQSLCSWRRALNFERGCRNRRFFYLCV